MIAAGTSPTPLGRRQHQIGMDRLPLANGGRAVQVFRTGESYLTGRSDEDPEELRGIVEGLGVRSTLLIPFDVAGVRRGVLSGVSARPDLFTERDLRFGESISRWIGVMTHRAELMDQSTHEAVQRGRREAAEELGRLTRREHDVAILIAQGLTNAEIAEQLAITSGTTANHVENMR